MQLDQDQSDDIEDRRGERRGGVIADHREARATLRDNLRNIGDAIGVRSRPDFSFGERARGLAADAGANDIPGYAKGGVVEGDDEEEDDEDDEDEKDEGDDEDVTGAVAPARPSRAQKSEEGEGYSALPPG